MPKDYRAIKILFGTFKGGGQKTDINKRERERERERDRQREKLTSLVMLCHLYRGSYTSGHFMRN